MSVGSLHVCLVEAVLTALDDEGESKFNPYVAVSVGQEKQKGLPATGTLQPHWNHNMVFNVNHPEASCLLTVWNANRYWTDDFLGCVRIRLSRLRDGLPKERWYKLRTEAEYDHIKQELGETDLLSMLKLPTKKPSTFIDALRESMSRGRVRIKVMFEVKESWLLSPSRTKPRKQQVRSAPGVVPDESDSSEDEEPEDEKGSPGDAADVPGKEDEGKDAAESAAVVVAAAAAAAAASTESSTTLLAMPILPTNESSPASAEAISTTTSFTPTTTNTPKTASVPEEVSSGTRGSSLAEERRSSSSSTSGLDGDGGKKKKARAKAKAKVAQIAEIVPEEQDDDEDKEEKEAASVVEEAASEVLGVVVADVHMGLILKETKEKLKDKTGQLRLVKNEFKKLREENLVLSTALEQTRTQLSELQAKSEAQAAGLAEGHAEVVRLKSENGDLTKLTQTIFEVEHERDALQVQLESKDGLLASAQDETKTLKRAVAVQKTGFEFRIRGLFKLADEDEMLLNQHPCANGIVYVFIKSLCVDLYLPVEGDDSQYKHKRLCIPYEFIKGVKRRSFLRYVKGRPGGLSLLFGAGKPPVKLDGFVDREACVKDIVSMCGSFGFQPEIL